MDGITVSTVIDSFTHLFGILPPCSSLFFQLLTHHQKSPPPSYRSTFGPRINVPIIRDKNVCSLALSGTEHRYCQVLHPGVTSVKGNITKGEFTVNNAEYTVSPTRVSRIPVTFLERVFLYTLNSSRSANSLIAGNANDLWKRSP